MFFHFTLQQFEVLAINCDVLYLWELHENNQALELINPEVKHICNKKQVILFMTVALLDMLVQISSLS